MNYNRYPATASANPPVINSITPSATATLTTTSSSSSSATPAPTAAKVYKGFGLSSESSYGGFTVTLNTDGKTGFRSGFDRSEKKKDEDPK